MKVKFKQWDCIAKGEKYLNSYRKAIQLIDQEDGSLVATATLNLSDADIKEDEVFIKNYSENEGMEDALIKAGIIEPEPFSFIKTNYVIIHCFKLTKKAINNLW